ncbi:hypothetical protein [Winogradskya consettensis]|nr:hypothetical protein [Actinoplanes consettensis]
MSAVVKWWGRMAAAMTGAALTLVVPVHAWAASKGVDGVAIEAVKYRRRSRGGFLPIFGGLCCLLVVGGIVLISRNRKRR